MRLKPLRPAELTPDQRALYDAINGGPRGPVHVGADGSLQGPFNAMLHDPAIGSPLQALGAALRYRGLLPPAARELAILTVAAAYRAEFEWHAHVPIAVSLGVPADAIDAIRHGSQPVTGDERSQAVVEVARALLAREELDDVAYARAVRLIGEPELVELSTLVGYYALIAGQLRLFRVPTPPGAVTAFGPAPAAT